MRRASPSSGGTRCARDDREPGLERPVAEELLGADEQLSLFAVISAIATDAAQHADDDEFPYELEELDDDGDEFELTLAPPPPLSGDGAAIAGGSGARRRSRGARRSSSCARRTRPSRASSCGARGMTHARVNAELNRLSSVRRISEATLEQLERRLACADRWLAKT